VDWIHLAQDRTQWLALVNTVTNMVIAWILNACPSAFLNWAPRHEGVLEKLKYSSTHSWLRQETEVNGQLHAPATLPLGYPSDRRLGMPQSWPGRCGEEKNSQSLSGPELPIIQPVRNPALYHWTITAPILNAIFEKFNVFCSCGTVC
jgi:hypothetical protein